MLDERIINSFVDKMVQSVKRVNLCLEGKYIILILNA